MQFLYAREGPKLVNKNYSIPLYSMHLSGIVPVFSVTQKVRDFILITVDGFYFMNAEGDL